jgi:hypothetical protein
MVVLNPRSKIPDLDWLQNSSESKYIVLLSYSQRLVSRKLLKYWKNSSEMENVFYVKSVTKNFPN